MIFLVFLGSEATDVELTGYVIEVLARDNRLAEALASRATFPDLGGAAGAARWLVTQEKYDMTKRHLCAHHVH